MKLIKILLLASFLATLTIYLFPRTWELDLITWLQEDRHERTVWFFQLISDSISYFSVGIPVLLILTGYIKHNKPLRDRAFLVLFSLALAGLLSFGVKNIVREQRPFQVDHRIEKLSGGGSYGFPSGHTLEAVTAAAAFSVLWPQGAVILASIVWVLLIMIARIYLGVHDLGDVTGGMFIGLLSFFFVMKVRDYVLRSKGHASAK